MMKKISVIFWGILFVPLFLGAVRQVTEFDMDVGLVGYTDEAAVSVLSGKTFLSGEFQDTFSRYFDAHFSPHGILTKTYCTLQYNVFRKGNRIVGEENYLFDDYQVSAYYAYGPDYDYSIDGNQNAMKDWVSEIEKLDAALKECGKKLYIYIAPNKTDMYSGYIPMKYRAIADGDAVQGVELFRELIKGTEVNYFIGKDIKGELKYPAFYASGMHMSRTYEQIANRKIIEDLRQLTGKNYRSWKIIGIKEQETPFWRDADVFDLQNLWNPLKGVFYEYEVQPVVEENFDSLNMILQGDSFGEGFLYDVRSLYDDDGIVFISRDDFVTDASYVTGAYDNAIPLNDSFADLDMEEYLKHADIVLLEMQESELNYYSYGFVSFMNNFLEDR